MYIYIYIYIYVYIYIYIYIYNYAFQLCNRQIYSINVITFLCFYVSMLRLTDPTLFIPSFRQPFVISLAFIVITGQRHRLGDQRRSEHILSRRFNPKTHSGYRLVQDVLGKSGN